MAPSIEPKPEQTEPSTQDLLTIPSVKEMESWDEEKVLWWIQQRNRNILRGNNLENFNKECIMGTAFLASDVEFYQTCGLPRGVGLALKSLADQVKEGKLSNQTAGRKRKEGEMDAPEPSISPKRNRHADTLSELAAKAREQRKLVREAITDLNNSSDQDSPPKAVDSPPKAAGSPPKAVDSPPKAVDSPPEAVDPLPGAVDKLSDPTFKRTFAFPFIGAVPERFKVDVKGGGYWSYEGRTKFKELLEKLNTVRKSRAHTTAWLYGTQGYGKSHLLAALVCYLAAQDERVVYIPDCRTWLRDPVGYVRAAMLFAWADDTTAQEEIVTLNTEKDIEEFFDPGQKIIFVVDEINALKNGSLREAKKRENLYDWLMRFTLSHKSVFSSSVNYTDFLEEFNRKGTNSMLRVYRGLNRMEMDQWWKRHPNVKKGEYDQSDVEDATGCIPLLLDKCVVDGKISLDVPYFREIGAKAMHFVTEIRDATRGKDDRWNTYCKYMTACFCRKAISEEWIMDVNLIDHRYFYRDNQRGNYTCGLVRDAVANKLLELEINFADTDFLNSLDTFINTRAMVGFLIEHAVLSSIKSKGLAIGEDIGKSMELRLITEPSDTKTDITDNSVLYRPEKSNFKAIDGMIVLIEPIENAAEGGKQKLFMFPLQITVADSHKDSHAMFFKDYTKWTRGLSEFDVEIQFLWITPERDETLFHPIKGKLPAHKERFIPLVDVNPAIWRKYQNAKKEARPDLDGCLTALGNNITVGEVGNENANSYCSDTTEGDEGMTSLA